MAQGYSEFYVPEGAKPGDVLICTDKGYKWVNLLATIQGAVEPQPTPVKPVLVVLSEGTRRWQLTAVDGSIWEMVKMADMPGTPTTTTFTFTSPHNPNTQG